MSSYHQFPSADQGLLISAAQAARLCAEIQLKQFTQMGVLSPPDITVADEMPRCFFKIIIKLAEKKSEKQIFHYEILKRSTRVRHSDGGACGENNRVGLL